MAAAPILAREIPVRATARWLVAHPGAVAVACGIIARVAAYLADRPYWLDEGSLVGCIGDLGRTGLFGPLAATQLAPPGFLLGEWGAISLLGDSRFAFRLIPLLAGIAALLLFRDLARRCLPPRVEWVAVALFAASDDLIYFSTEVKQYSSDLALTLLLLAVAGRDARGPTSPRHGFGWAALGAGVAWCSHPSVFTLAAIGAVGLLGAARARDARRVVGWALVGLAWVASVAAVHAVAMRQLGHRRDMWAFWDFAFPPLPPRSPWDAAWPLRRAAYLFTNPLNFGLPLGGRWSGWPAVALALVGARRLARVGPGRLALLLGPGGFALLAAYLRLYPFHGRLVLFAAPLLLIPVAAGFEAVGDRRWLRGVLLAWVLGGPVLVAGGHLVEPRGRDANPYGDRRPTSLDPYWFPLARPPGWPRVGAGSGRPGRE